MRRVRWTTGTNRLLRPRGEAQSGAAVSDRPQTHRRRGCGRPRPRHRPRPPQLQTGHELFEAATGGQWTLHQLRHTRLSHFADDGVDLHALKAISGHRSFRSLEDYLHASDDAVRRVYDHCDPDPRRRRPGAGD